MSAICVKNLNFIQFITGLLFCDSYCIGGVILFLGTAGDESNPSNWQSASRSVKSFAEPRNLDANSSSLTLSFTLAPLT